MEFLFVIGIGWLIYNAIADQHSNARGRQAQSQIDSYARAKAMNNKYQSQPPKKLNVQEKPAISLTLSKNQQALLDLLENTNDDYYITGKAGTGKSVLLEHFIAKTDKNVAVLAPTGVAALNIGGQTIHSFFKFKPRLLEPHELEVDAKTARNLRHVDAILIDEVSMVRADLMEAMSVKLQLAKKNDAPFGGVQMILFGDLYQLPPVVREKDEYDYFTNEYGGYYFFNAHAMKDVELKIYELSEIFRQKDSEFKQILNTIRQGRCPKPMLDKLNMRVCPPPPDGNYVTLAGTNQTVDSTNRRKLRELKSESRTYEAEIYGDIKENSFPTEELLELKVGAQVMLLRNDAAKRWVNGTLATVAALGEEMIKVDIDGQAYQITRETWEQYKYTYDPEEGKLVKEVISSFTQFPLRLAWAMTIHKSQGKTYQSVAIDLSRGAFAHGQTYVALSRCTRLEEVYLTSPIQSRDIIIDHDVVSFMQKAVEI